MAKFHVLLSLPNPEFGLGDKVKLITDLAYTKMTSLLLGKGSLKHITVHHIAFLLHNSLRRIISSLPQASLLQNTERDQNLTLLYFIPSSIITFPQRTNFSIMNNGVCDFLLIMIHATANIFIYQTCLSL